MKKNETALICQYIYNNRVQMEEEIRELQTRLRFRPLSVGDAVQLICAQQRFETFLEVTNHIKLLLNF